MQARALSVLFFPSVSSAFRAAGLVPFDPDRVLKLLLNLALSLPITTIDRCSTSSQTVTNATTPSTSNLLDQHLILLKDNLGQQGLLDTPKA